MIVVVGFVIVVGFVVVVVVAVVVFVVVVVVVDVVPFKNNLKIIFFIKLNHMKTFFF